MDGREHDPGVPSPPGMLKQECYSAAVGTCRVSEAEREWLLSLLQQVRTGDEQARFYLREQLQHRNVVTQTVLIKQAEQGDTLAQALLQTYYQSLLEQARAGKEDAAIYFRGQLQAKNTHVQAFLVEEVERGNGEAFDVIQAHYWEEIRRYLGRLIEECEAKSDLMQEIFLKAWLSFPTRTQKHATHIRAWLYKVAHSVAVDYLRSEKARMPIPLEGGREDTSIQGSEDGV